MPLIGLDRRRFLRGAGGLVLAAPLVLPAKRVLAARDTWTDVRDFYVAANGSDTNDGFTSLAPARELQQIVGYISRKSDTEGFGARIHVGNGSYRSVMTEEYSYANNTYPFSWIPLGRVEFIGNEATPSQCVIAGVGTEASGWTPHAIRAHHGSAWYAFSGFKLQSQNGWGFYGGCRTVLTNIEWSVCAGGHMLVNNLWATIEGNHWVESDAPYHVYVEFLSTCHYKPATVTSLGQRYFSGAFVRTTNGALMESHSVHFPNKWDFYGMRYWASSGSRINTYGYGSEYFPGTSPGVADSGAIYI